ncbi:MAG TPA: glycosyltransferase [Thermoplasmata archaeon]|nr:glycosyltransferase [Thermoplasmata archaeon]
MHDRALASASGQDPSNLFKPSCARRSARSAAAVPRRSGATRRVVREGSCRRSVPREVVRDREEAPPAGPSSQRPGQGGESPTDPRAVSVILPILNEEACLPTLLERFDAIADEVPIRELVFVDDGSTDGTLGILERQAARPHRFAIRVLARHERRGQVDACISGARLAACESVVVMDADLQHPPESIGPMLAEHRRGVDIVVGSRHAEGAVAAREPLRGVVSRGAMFLARLLLPWTRSIDDPMSGFFLGPREPIARLRLLRGRVKLLLYLEAVRPDLKVGEVPYEFRERSSGRSKTVTIDLKFVIRYLVEILTYAKISGSSDPRFVVGSS